MDLHLDLRPEATLRDLAVSIPGATRVFETHRLDYCCGGARSLEDACASAGLDTGRLLAALSDEARAEAERGSDPEAAPGSASLEALVAHIVEHHHAFMRSEGERLAALANKVMLRHGAAHPELLDVDALLAALRDDMAPHMMKEERMLFPFVVALERAATSGAPPPRTPFGTVANPIRMMTLDHETTGRQLAELRVLTSDYALPEGACESYRALYQGLAGLERDLVRHVHLENNVLFPRAEALEHALESRR